MDEILLNIFIQITYSHSLLRKISSLRDAMRVKGVVFTSVYLSKAQKLITLVSTFLPPSQTWKKEQMSLYEFSDVTFLGCV